MDGDEEALIYFLRCSAELQQLPPTIH